MFHTLVDFMTATEAGGYLTAFLLLFLFIAFWKFLTERESN